MGQGNSHMLFVHVLKNMLHARGTKVGQKQLEHFLDFIVEVCPWFPEEETLNLETRSKVGTKFQDYYWAYGPKNVPVDTFSLWNLIRDCLDPCHEGQCWSQHEREKSLSCPSLEKLVLVDSVLRPEIAPSAPQPVEAGKVVELRPPPENPYEKEETEKEGFFYLKRMIILTMIPLFLTLKMRMP